MALFAMVNDAPVLFSATIGLPTIYSAARVSNRQATSPVPPAGEGMMKVIGLRGNAASD
jgi:hypothetical protein